jgi:hypothetical protein
LANAVQPDSSRLIPDDWHGYEYSIDFEKLEEDAKFYASQEKKDYCEKALRVAELNYHPKSPLIGDLHVKISEFTFGEEKDNHLLKAKEIYAN